MVQPRDRFIPADFFCTTHYIFGQLKVVVSGLMGMLTDTTTSTLEMHDASVAYVHKMDKVVNYAPVLQLVRAQVVAVGLSKREYLGLQGVMRGGFQRLVPYQVQIATSMFEMTGTIEWSGRFEFPALMSEGTSAFFILNDAVLTAPLFPALRYEAATIIVNRNFLNTLAVLRQGSSEA